MPGHAIEQMNAMADDSLDAAQMRIAVMRGGRPMRHGKVPRRRDALLDLSHGEIDGELSTPGIRATQEQGGHEHSTLRQPVARIDHDPAQTPRHVVEQQVADRTDRAVACARGIAHHHAGFPQHGAAPTDSAEAWPVLRIGDRPDGIDPAQ